MSETPAKRKEPLTEKQKAFLAALAGEANGCPVKAKEMASYSKHTTLVEVTRGLIDEMADVAHEMLALNAPKAVGGLVTVLDNPNDLGARNRIAAAAQLLDRSGFGKKEQVEVTTPLSGLVFLPVKDGDTA